METKELADFCKGVLVIVGTMVLMVIVIIFS